MGNLLAQFDTLWFSIPDAVRFVIVASAPDRGGCCR
jgi:hypothetical protein